MSTTQAKIAAKKLTEETGVPDALSDTMFHRQSGHWVAIVDLAHLDRTEGRDEKHVVRLEISQLEVLDGDMAEHARQLMRANYLSRQPEPLFDAEGEDPNSIVERGKNALLTCPTCLHSRVDEAIDHWKGDVDADGAFCNWAPDGCEVKAGETYEEHQDAEHPDRGEEEVSDDDPVVFGPNDDEELDQAAAESDDESDLAPAFSGADA